MICGCKLCLELGDLNLEFDFGGLRVGAGGWKAAVDGRGYKGLQLVGHRARMLLCVTMFITDGFRTSAR